MLEMRRKKQMLSAEQNIAILQRGTSGVLAVQGDAGYPYAVPLNYLYSDAKIYFHGAKEGYKMDAIRHNSKASFCVIDADTIVPQEYTSYFRSVIATGKVSIVTDAAEKRSALLQLAQKYTPNDPQGCLAVVERQLEHVCVLLFTMEHLTGKAASELL